MQHQSCCGMPYGQHSVGCGNSPSYNFYRPSSDVSYSSIYNPSSTSYYNTSNSGYNTTSQSMYYSGSGRYNETSSYDSPTGIDKNRYGGRMVSDYHTSEELAKKARELNCPLIATELIDTAINERRHEAIYNPKIPYSNKAHINAIKFLEKMDNNLDINMSSGDYNTQLEKFERKIYGDKFEEYRS